MPRMVFKALVPALVALVAVPGAAQARKRHHWLWATVNVCDTRHHPDTIGIAARMPGNGTHERMYMRFVAQYRDKKGRWRLADRSGWVYIGNARYLWRQSGYRFPFNRQATPASYLMRGYVGFQWRKKRRHRHGWRVVRRAHRLTRAGHRHTDDADPKGYSAARCRINTAPL